MPEDAPSQSLSVAGSRDRLFLDANVLYSAARLPASRMPRLWQLPAIVGAELLTCGTAAGEAVRNAANKPPPSGPMLPRLLALLERVDVVPDVRDPQPRRGLQALSGWPVGVAELPDKDRPILLAALSAGATHLLTGDHQHFGGLFGHTLGQTADLPGVLVLPPREYLDG